MDRGLIERRIYSLPDHNIQVEEIWDLYALGCPFIRNPWISKVRSTVKLYHHVYGMTQAQFVYHTKNNWKLLS